jgi:hypothetical protein
MRLVEALRISIGGRKPIRISGLCHPILEAVQTRVHDHSIPGALLHQYGRV